MTAFALYRLPFAQHYTRVEQTDGDPDEMWSLESLNGRRGFVFAPFVPSPACPILLIRPDKVSSMQVRTLPDIGQEPTAVFETDDREAYAANFALFHSHILAGHFQKIVLARQRTVSAPTKPTSLQLFARACLLYPRMFVALVSTRRSGQWLAATPEVLLKGGHGQWSSMALAGTMPAQDSRNISSKCDPADISNISPKCSPALADSACQGIVWSAKNIREQRYVATYIAESLTPFVTDFKERGPYTSRACRLLHLRSDFTFTLRDEDRLGNVLDVLHPTPAVCGLPKQQALSFIQAHESEPRRYYSGFLGPLDMEGLTHLCVSLRCMELTAEGYRLYAGGGLVGDSCEDGEWRETEAKMATMGEVIGL